MVKLAMRMVAFRKGSFVAAFLVLALGTAIVTACGGLLETGIRQDHVTPNTAARFADNDELISVSAVFGGLAVLVAMFIVISTLGLSVAQRQREMALLRALGATPAQLRKLVLGETAMVALLVAAAGLPLSWLLGRTLLIQLTNAGVVRAELVYHQGLVPTLVGAGTTVLSALVAAFVAGRATAIARPTSALGQAANHIRWMNTPRLFVAIFRLAGGLALSLVTGLVMSGPAAASTAGPTAMLWASGLALLSPGLSRVLLQLLHYPIRVIAGLAGFLGMRNVIARRNRSAAAITPIMLATGLATASLYLQTTQDAAASAISGIVLGLAVAATTLVPFAIAVNGSPWPQGPLSIYGGITLGAIALTMLATLVATSLLRISPVGAAATQ